MSSEEMFTYLTMGAVFGRTFRVYWDQFVVFLSLSVVLYLPFVAFMVTYMKTLAPVMKDLIIDPNDPNFDPEKYASTLSQDFSMSLARHATALTIEYVALGVFGIVGRVALMRATAEIYAGQAPSITGCLKQGINRFCSVLGASALIVLFVLMMYLPMVGFIVLAVNKQGIFNLLAFLYVVGALIVYVYAILALSMVVPALVIEGVGPVRSLQRAWELANGRRCYIFCSLFLFGMLQFVVTQIFVKIMTAGDPQAALSTYGIVVSTVPAFFFLPLAEIMTTVLYMSVRVDKEGLNAEVLQRNLGGVAVLDEHDYSTLPPRYSDNDETHVKDGMEAA